MRHQIRWTSVNVARRLSIVEGLVHRHRQPLPIFQFTPLEEPTSVIPDEMTGVELSPGMTWGEPGQDFLLRTEFTVPTTWLGDEPIVLFLPLGIAGDFSHPEALIFIDGEPCASCDRHHQEISLDQRWCDGRKHSLDLIGWTGGTQTLRFDASAGGAPPRSPLIMGTSELVQIHQLTREYVALARVALGVADALTENNPTRHHLLTALSDAFNALDIREPVGDAFYETVPYALNILQEGVERAGPSLDVDITAIGHAHIDVAWLWTLAQTRQKARRSFHTVLRLMERFPEFVFGQSQPQLYEYVREDDPALFSAIQARVEEGRWEPMGGMWIEADCNLSGPESLARQFVLGRVYFQEYFGQDAESPVLWLPDVFGFPWSLPQLIREAGLNYFFTIKIGWSQYNRFPYDSFWWQGIDGTQVLTHFGTTKNAASAFAATYNAEATPEQVLSTWRNFQQKDYGAPGVTPPLLMAYGHGDGGGGPSREMLENIGLMGEFPGAPHVQMGRVREFFETLDTKSGDGLPVWNGELYLEYHRGVYTSQARTKRANRKNEFLLHDAEFLTTYASLLDCDHPYPSERLRGIWRLLALNQFHDILPGSSIGPVYEDAQAQHLEISQHSTHIRNEALHALAAKLGGDLLVVNPTSFSRSDPAFCPGTLPEDVSPAQEGGLLPTQHVEGGVLIAVNELPPYSVTPITIKSGYPTSTSACMFADPSRLENDYVRVDFNSSGDITGIRDKLIGRDVLSIGATANQFQAFEDLPKTPDAWEIDIFYDDKLWLAEEAKSIKVVERGPLRCTLEIRRRILNSVITQRISLLHNSSRIDFDTHVLWNERHILLKVAFPVDVLAPAATYEIPWGSIQRPTHRNTSWDWARFEVPAQKWADLSEGDYGVSLLNDCKYGYDIHSNIMRLTLLRSPTDPDPNADRGEHQFTYSLFPHVGPMGDATLAEAYALNDPIIVVRGDGRRAVAAEPRPLVAVDTPNIVIETIKQAEDGRGVIVRLYESQRQRGPFTLTASFPFRAARRTNFLEETVEEVAVNSNQLQYHITPFQILTFYLEP